MNNWDWLVVGVFVWALLLFFVMGRCFTRADREPLNEVVTRMFIVVVKLVALSVAAVFVAHAPNPFHLLH